MDIRQRAKAAMERMLAQYDKWQCVVCGDVLKRPSDFCKCTWAGDRNSARRPLK